MFILILYFITIFIVFNRFFINKNIDITINFLKLYLPERFINFFIKNSKKFKFINDTIFYVTIIIINLFIIFFICMSIYGTSELLLKLDEYVNVYNKFFKK